MARGVAQPGSAPRWGCGGRRFESSRPDHDHLSFSFIASAPLKTTEQEPPYEP